MATQQHPTPLMSALEASFGQTPSQTVGPYFAYGLTGTQYGYAFDQPFDSLLARPDAAGEHIVLEGVVYDGNGVSVPDALIEISQAGADGRHVASPADAAARGFTGFGRVGTGTDSQQCFRFFTVKPGAQAGGESPHIDMVVLMRGLLLHAFTRVYFSDEAPANAADPVLREVDAERRHTLVALRSARAAATVYRFDIHLQGPDETVFFDV